MIFLVHFRVAFAPSQNLRPTPRGGIGLVLKTSKAADTELIRRIEDYAQTIAAAEWQDEYSDGYLIWMTRSGMPTEVGCGIRRDLDFFDVQGNELVCFSNIQHLEFRIEPENQVRIDSALSGKGH